MSARVSLQKRQPDRTGRVSLDVAVVNNMPDSALEATEQQFLSLLDAASDGIDVRVTFYALATVVRGEAGLRHVRSYALIGHLMERPPDGLIVTGAEPLAEDLTGETYWRDLTGLLDWTEESEVPAIWSCLAAHAAVRHFDGIERRRLARKQFGVFECERFRPHRLMKGVRSPIRLPHSRWNDVDEEALTSSGYLVLTRTPFGVDTFVREGKSLSLFFQGHPEYSGDTLMREYRRDFRRYLGRERDSCPDWPEGYFDPSSLDKLEALRDAALSVRDDASIDRFMETLPSVPAANTWSRPASRIYRNWLDYLMEQKLETRAVSIRGDWSRS